MKLVIDSSNNRPATADVLRVSHAVALISKATEGTSFHDGTLSGQRNVAHAVGVPFGSYLFLHPNSRGSEAAYYLDYARPRPGDIQPVIDAEVTNMGIPDLARRVESCARALEHGGYAPILYASSSVWKELVKADAKIKRLKVWEAQYPGRFTRWFPRLSTLRVALTRGAVVVMWQWTDSFAVGGQHFDASALLVDIKTITVPAKATPKPAGGGRTPGAE